MLKLALKQLQLDKVRTLLTVTALGAIVSVILVLKGFEQGQYQQLRQMVLNRNAELIATQAGVKNFIATRSVIPQFSRAEVEAIKGVKEAHPITAIPIIYSNNNIRTPVYVIVYDTAGGPSKLLAGTAPTRGTNIVIDYSLAQKYNLQIGDKFVVSDFEFTIAGITQEAAFMMPFAFINYDGMIDLFLESEIAPDLSTFPILSYMLIELESDKIPQTVAYEIESKVKSVDIYSAEQIAMNDVSLGRTFFAPIMGVLVFVGYIIGLLVISLIMYSDISNNKKNYAVLKALGFPFYKLVMTVFFMSVLLLLVAIPIGSILAFVVALSIEHSAPVYLIQIFELSVFSQTLLACSGFALVGSFVPLISIKRCDPLLAFQGG